MHADSPDLRTLINPLSLDEFFERYWESRPLVLERRGATRVAALLTVTDVEFLTASLGSLDAKWIRLVNNGRQNGPLREFQRSGEGLAMERVLEAYGEGTTVVLNDLQQRWPAVRDLARRLWRDFNDSAELPLRAVGANAYLSPPGAQGLPIHFDTHCVFILQLSGRKAWTLYEEREELPSPGKNGGAASWRSSAALSTLHDVVLEPGDVIYIPRGLAHEARTADSHSLHLAVGLYPYTWGDALAQAMRALPELRRSLPRGLLSAGAPPPLVARQLSAAVTALRVQATSAAALAPLRTEIDQLRESLRGNGFERHHAIAAIASSSRVTRVSDAPLRVRRQGEKVVLEHDLGSPLQAPAAAEAALRYVVDHETFVVSSLPDVLSESSKLVLVKRLLRDGVLELASANESRLADPVLKVDASQPC